MEKHSALLIFESLSSGSAPDVYRLLVRKGMEGMAGEIATTLDAAEQSVLSFQGADTASACSRWSRRGVFQRYRANIPLMLDSIAYLTGEVLRRSAAVVRRSASSVRLFVRRCCRLCFHLLGHLKHEHPFPLYG